MADQEVFDLSYLSDAADGDLEFVQGVLDEYVLGTEALLAEAARAMAVYDYEALRRTTHSVRGASASIGALRVAATAGRLEDLVRARVDLITVQDLFGELCAEFRVARELVARTGAPMFMAT